MTKTVLVSLLSGSLYAAGIASSIAQSPDLATAANEIVASCSIGPTETLHETLSAKLEEFLRGAIGTKSAKTTALTEVLAQIPTETEEAIALIKVQKARELFFAIYFKCIREQTALKMKSLNIALE
jgi:hypothetical protein